MIAFIPAGLLFLAVAPASGLLTLPPALMCLGIAWWAQQGAPAEPSTPVRVLLFVGTGLTVGLFVLFVALTVAN